MSEKIGTISMTGDAHTFDADTVRAAWFAYQIDAEAEAQGENPEAVAVVGAEGMEYDNEAEAAAARADLVNLYRAGKYALRCADIKISKRAPRGTAEAYEAENDTCDPRQIAPVVRVDAGYRARSECVRFVTLLAH